MTDNPRDRMEAAQQDMRNMAEAGLDQARKAFETFLATAQKTASTFEGQGQAAHESAKDISSKAVAFAEKNIASSLDYADKLLKAKDVTDVMRLHAEYVQAQMRALADQAGEMGQAVTRSAMDAARPK